MKRNQYGVTFYNPSKAYNGYTLFAPLGCKDVWLIDMQGLVVHHWPLPNNPGCYGKLLPNGHLIYGCRSDPDKREKAGAPKLSGFGGLLREVDWDDNLIWEYEDHFMHHDFYRMENGNTLVLKYIKVPQKIAAEVKGGVPETEDNGKMWCDSISEITSEGKVVWEWLSHEHLDPVENSICPLCLRKEWTHGNTCVVLSDGDILTCFRQTNSVCIIDKKTGDIKWQWGRGLGELAHGHDAQPLPNGNILIFDNGFHRAGVELTSSMVIELNPKTKKIEWEYRGDPITDFYSAACSGAQRLPNGNTLICSSMEARIFEITKKGEIVWEYINPFFGEIEFGRVNWVFRAYRYGPDYEGLEGKKLSPEKFDSWNRLYSSSVFRS